MWPAVHKGTLCIVVTVGTLATLCFLRLPTSLRSVFLLARAWSWAWLVSDQHCHHFDEFVTSMFNDIASIAIHTTVVLVAWLTLKRRASFSAHAH